MTKKKYFSKNIITGVKSDITETLGRQSEFSSIITSMVTQMIFHRNKSLKMFDWILILFFSLIWYGKNASILSLELIFHFDVTINIFFFFFHNFSDMKWYLYYLQKIIYFFSIFIFGFIRISVMCVYCVCILDFRFVSGIGVIK